MTEYPNRKRFFANRFVRLLTKTAAAMQIGPESCWLLCIISQLEDSKRYTGPVLFWNEQLMTLCGFGSRKRLVTARNRAVEAGWLHYERGHKSKAPRYWVLIPPQFEKLPDGPCDETPDEYGHILRSDSGRNSEPNRGAHGALRGRQEGAEGALKGHLSFLTLKPPPEKGAGDLKNKNLTPADAWLLACEVAQLHSRKTMAEFRSRLDALPPAVRKVFDAIGRKQLADPKPDVTVGQFRKFYEAELAK